MELIAAEREVKESLSDVQAPQVLELIELQLSMVGGGVGEISPY